MDTQTEKLTIQQVAEVTGLSVHTLRYYERIGLIHPIGRAENTHRCYSTDDTGWIDFLTKLRNAGMSIPQMQAYSELQRQGESPLAERFEMLKAHRRKGEAQIAELNQHMKLTNYKNELNQGVLAEATPE